MKNQVSIDNQNTQPVGQNPISQQSEIQVKPKANLWMVSTIVLLALLFGGASLYFLNSNKQRDQIGIVPSPTAISGTKETPTIKPTETLSVKPGWKLYKDGEVGYSLQYPDTWYSDDKKTDQMGGATQILWLTTHKNLPSTQAADLGLGDNVRLGVNYIKNIEKISLKGQMKKHVQPDFADNPPENIKSTWITVGGLESHRYIYYPDNKWGSPGVYTTIKIGNGDFIRLVAIILHDFDTYLNQVIETEDSFKVL